MDIQSLLEQFILEGDIQKQLQLSDRSFVVGTHVDENNILWYYRESEGNITLDPAKDYQVIYIFPIQSQKTVHITMNTDVVQ